MRVYLDNCVYNRPYDDQSQIRIRLETEAKLFIQSMIDQNLLELVWSYIIDIENEENPFAERKMEIQKWKSRAIIDVEEKIEILENADAFQKKCGLKGKDSLHIACAVYAKCGYFITADDILHKRMQRNESIAVIDPITFIREVI